MQCICDRLLPTLGWSWIWCVVTSSVPSWSVSTGRQWSIAKSCGGEDCGVKIYGSFDSLPCQWLISFALPFLDATQRRSLFERFLDDKRVVEVGM